MGGTIAITPGGRRKGKPGADRHWRLGGSHAPSVRGRENLHTAPVNSENQRGRSGPGIRVTVPVIEYDTRVDADGRPVVVLRVRSGGISPGKLRQGYSVNKATARKSLAAYLRARRKEGARRVDVIVNATGGATAFAQGYGEALARCGMRGRVLIDGACSSAATILIYTPRWPVAITQGSHMQIHYARRKRFRHRKGVWEYLGEQTGQLGLSTTDDVMLRLYRRRTHKPEELIRDWMATEHRFTAAEAVVMGLADEMCLRAEWEARNG